MTSSSQVNVSRTDYRGWHDAYVLENDLVSLVALPDVGGRLIAYGLHDESVLWLHPKHLGKLYSFEENLGDGSLAAFKNVGGSKAWPAPQGWDGPDQWPGPPDPVLDSGRYKAQIIAASKDKGTLEMTSLADVERTGLRVTRRVSLANSTTLVDLEVAFMNVSKGAVAWSIWENTQLDCTSKQGGWTDQAELYVPLGESGRFPDGYTILYGAKDNPQWHPDPATGLLSVKYLWKVGKIGLDSEAGWLAFCNSETGTVFCSLFNYDTTKADLYPDGGCSVEVWTAGEGVAAGVDWGAEPLYHLEAEVLGPVVNLEPGNSTSLNLKWATCKAAGAIVNVNEAGCVSRRLACTGEQDRRQLSGSYGVFHRANATLVLQRGKNKEKISLGNVTPASPFNVNVPLEPAWREAEAAELVLELATGEVMRLDKWFSAIA